jgi:glycosyltransferase involved in cell wall biosynthesis
MSKRIHCMHYGRRLRELLREPWDLVHCWEEPYIFSGGQVAWWTPSEAPFVFWTAQNLSKRYPPPFCWIERYCLERCAGWLACGQSIADTLLRRGYHRKPYRIMPLGVDLNSFRSDPQLHRELLRRLGWNEAGPPIVGYSGRFVADKGLPMLMRVLDRLPTQWRALLIGGGPLEKELRTWAARHGDRVRIVTGLTHDEVPLYLNGMDVLCAPSQTTPKWREQLGRMLIEAFACGVAVMGSDSGEIPHVLNDAGVVVGERDEAGWGQHLAALLESPARRAELAAQGLERARDVYAWPVIARQHLQFFEEIIDNTSQQAGRRRSVA